VAGVCFASLAVASPASADNKDRDRGKDLDVYKTAEGHFKRGDCKFDVDKKVKDNDYRWRDYATIYSKDDTEKVDYRIDVSRNCDDGKDFYVKGKIYVKNDNKRDAKHVYVKDDLERARCKIYGYGDRIRAYETKVFEYKCDVYGAHEGDYGVNKATVYWDRDSIKSPHSSAYDTERFKFDKADNDRYGYSGCVKVFDKIDYDYYVKKWELCDDDFHYDKAQIEYDRELKVPDYGCKEFRNKAWEDKSYSDDYATVKLCRERR